MLSEGMIQMNTIARFLTRTLNKMNMAILAVAVVLAMAMCCPMTLAQSGAGSIEGTVTDSTGAVISGASVHVVNRATAVSTVTKSDHAGFYQVPDLFTGTYDITISAPGFKTYTTSIDLLVAQNAVVNPMLPMGAVTQQVTVAGNTVQLTTSDSGAISSTLENERISQLPENGRELINLTGLTTPGLELSDSEQRVNGLSEEALQYVADGVTTTNIHYGGTTTPRIQLQDPDSIQEVQMAMNGASAQYSTPATGVVTTKSGTNGLHGTFFETAENNAIGVAKDRQDPATFTAPPLIRNEFGASAGGPIILPHVYHGKDKSFWFFAYERFSESTRAVASYEVPTMAMRQGNFSGAFNAAGILQTIYDPSTTVASSSACAASGVKQTYCRTAFPNNTIPSSEESPTAKVFYDLMPQPTSAANPLVADNLTVANNVFEVVPQATFRLDHVFNDNNRAYLRFSDVDQSADIGGSPRSLAADGLPAGAAEGYTNNPGQSFFAAAGYTHTFSPTFFAETIAGEQWYEDKLLTGSDYTANYESQLGLPNNFGEPGFPTVSGIINGLTSSQANTYTDQIIWNVDENLTKIVGAHQLHFGGRWEHVRLADLPQGLADAVAFGVLPTSLYEASSGANYDNSSNAGLGDASMFLGSPTSYTINLEPPHDHYHWNELDGYFQDDYHVSRNLTLNLGMRYEAHPAIWNKYGLMNSFDFKNDAMVLAVPPATLIAEGYTTQAIITNDENIGVKFETPQEAGMPAALMDNYNLNFLPRGGVAYQLSRKLGTVIRGAYGRYLFNAAAENYLNHPQKNNPLIATYSQSYATAAQAIDGLPNELLRYNDPVQFGEMGVNQANAVNSSTTNSILPGISLWSDSTDWAPLAASTVNFTVEQPFKGNSALRVSWVWSHLTNLSLADDYNFHPSTYQWEMSHGAVPPNGGASVIGTPQQNTYSTTATGPYDQTTWASGTTLHTENGVMNSNALQANYQRLFHHGIAFQLYYVFSKVLQTGGNNQAPNSVPVTLYPYADYPGGEGTVATMSSPYGTVGPSKVIPPPPANVPNWQMYRAQEHSELYFVDGTLPYHHIQFNGVVDLPFGRGKRFFGNANRFVNEAIGGFQIAGDGSIASQVFNAPNFHFGPVSPIQIYKHKYPITDCTSGVCYKGYLWFNGYIPPTDLPAPLGTCTTNCVTGVPASYLPAQTPIDNTPGTTFYQDDEVQITAPNLNGGKATNIAYDAGPLAAHYYDNEVLNGPFNWDADASIFKVFPIKESLNLRIDMDAFNVFNHQGFTNPAANNGEEQVQPGSGVASSYNAPRQVQITARLTF
jgi:hypothetical protein